MLSFQLSRPITLLATAGLLAVPARMSDPVGCYAMIDQVILEPNAQAPKAIQLWGVFAMTDGKPGNLYLPAERGYLYYKITPGSERATLAEWADMKAMAGKGDVIGFAARYIAVGKVRRASEPPKNPDPYPLGSGLINMRNQQSFGQTSVTEVANVPGQASPTDGGCTSKGPAKFVAKNVGDATVQYVFELVGPGNKREQSAPTPAGAGGQTTWVPKMLLTSGAEYTWRVWTVKGSWKGQPAIATFHVE